MDIEMLHLPLKAKNGHWLPDNAEVEAARLNGELFIAGSTPICRSCGIHPSTRVAGDVAEVKDPCPHPDGITTEITIDVPSGKLLVTDDLRPVYNWDDDTMASYESALGKAQAVKAMAAIGCAFGPASNCGLGLYRTGPDSYIIASPRADDEDNPSLPESTRLAGICTDLWAYSIADFQAWKSRGGDPANLGWSDTVVDVPPGTYQFVHHSGERGFDLDAAETVTFAHVQRISPSPTA
ncbi:hypothetical protein ABR737_01650 [Streptomyces sp. Edi2]|uniref:hypothetical protein n=1 Tax=Streptomyces sp. Edi2 TaxID=3162528 RepID=UPI0033065234